VEGVNKQKGGRGMTIRIELFEKFTLVPKIYGNAIIGFFGADWLWCGLCIKYPERLRPATKAMMRFCIAMAEARKGGREK